MLDLRNARPYAVPAVRGQIAARGSIVQLFDHVGPAPALVAQLRRAGRPGLIRRKADDSEDFTTALTTNKRSYRSTHTTSISLASLKARRPPFEVWRALAADRVARDGMGGPIPAGVGIMPDLVLSASPTVDVMIVVVIVVV